MARILSIRVQVKTADAENAGTDGDVYLGLCGREFFLDSSGNDFERGASHTYVLGNGENVINARENDPRLQTLWEDDVEKFPIYLRLSPV